MIPFLMTCFETLNPMLKHAHLLVIAVSLKMKVTCLRLEHPLKSLFDHLPLENYFCLGDYLYHLLHVKILLFGGTTMKGSFKLWYSSVTD
jgi:hypothetical protein